MKLRWYTSVSSIAGSHTPEVIETARARRSHRRALVEDEALLRMWLLSGNWFAPRSTIWTASRWTKEAAKGWIGSDRTPAGFALFPKDIAMPPREWAERFFNVVRWTEMEKGGHFAALEQPAALAEDIRAFFRPLR
ncbi:alpha/beta fold hydrolase [Rhizobium sp. RAF56]|uniref:alpha/beta fold hydrolase n=1 Tax=Rhizobium sp. RAF56 TaxID=3233062 RepID=UPI003F965F29